MNITLERKWKKSTYTIGIVYVNNIRFSESVEDADRGLADTMNEAEITARKIYGKTAIPTGTYEIELTYSPKFATRAWGKKYKGLVPEIKKVKGFSGVRIHPLNTAEDSLGCIGCGRNLEKGKVLYATEYYYKLMDNYIVPASKRGEKMTITIK
jgi:hypothetical protein